MIAFAAALAVFAGQQSGTTVDETAQRRQRIAALIADLDCDGAHGAVFVLADRPLLEWVESICPMGAFDIVRWDRYLPAEFAGMFTEAQLRSARALVLGDEPLVSTEPPEQAPDAMPSN